jgi:hypothetical protein
MRIRKSRSGPGAHRRNGESFGDAEKAVSSIQPTAGGPLGGGEVVLDEVLPEPASDKQIMQKLTSLNDFIDQHIRHSKAYHTEPIKSSEAVVLQSITNSGIKVNPGLSSHQLTALLLNPSTRADAICHVISWVIFSNIDWMSPSKALLFPEHITAFLLQIPPVEWSARGSQEGT